MTKREKKGGGAGARLGTIIVTAVVTSMFWVIVMRSGPIIQYPEAIPGEGLDLQGAAKPSKKAVAEAPKDKLLIPVLGASSSLLSDTWGDARSEGRSHEAIDIMAPRGTPVVAAAPGTIEKIFESEPGGHTVYIRSEDGNWIYYYAHLDSYAPGLEEGQKLSRGDPIGGVGDTGNAGAGNTHLHFAVNRMGPSDGWWQGTAINPYPLLAGKPGRR